MLHLDADYHNHLSGSIPYDMVQKWFKDGDLPEDRMLTDLFPGPNHGKKLTVSQALSTYRGGRSFLDAYQARYQNIEAFLTMFRAYAEGHLVDANSTAIARAIFPKADVRVTVPDASSLPYYPGKKEIIPPLEWSRKAIAYMIEQGHALGPDQNLVIHFPRLYFTNNKNREYLAAFLSLMKGQTELKPFFDFANFIRPVSETIEVVQTVREAYPLGTVLYHHGEFSATIPQSQRIADGHLLAPYVNRLGHGICFGQVPADLREAADNALRTFAERRVGIEVCPTSNLTLGGAHDLSYVRHFLDMGVDVFAGTDDPGFLNCTLESEADQIREALGIKGSED
eukprot:GAFH01002685.1.p1 GENE.GAFH01002685.1~~GAFH01002685.1.p1  ORF type:complete len:348 (-),score=38.86 GAFH01002685.1:55-1074(-)